MSGVSPYRLSPFLSLSLARACFYIREATQSPAHYKCSARAAALARDVIRVRAAARAWRETRLDSLARSAACAMQQQALSKYTSVEN